MQVNIDTIEPDQEVTENILLGRGDVGEKGADDGFAGRELLSNGDEQLERLSINISDVDTTLTAWRQHNSDIQPKANSLSEEDPVALPGRVDADVVLSLSRMRAERLNDEGVKSTGGLLNRHGFAGPLLDPSASLLPALVEAKETSLSSSLNKLIGLAHELRGKDPVGETLPGLDRRRELFGSRIPLKKVS